MESEINEGKCHDGGPTEPSASDWRRAARELNPPPTEDFPTALVLGMLLTIAPAIIVLLIWLLK